MYDETTQVTLLERLREPDNQLAWRQFDSKYRDLILRYCRARGLRLADAEDVHQNVLFDLSRSMAQFHYEPTRGRFRTYLGTVVRHAISRFLSRQARPEGPLDNELLATLPESNAEPDETWEQEWVRNHYRAALRKLRATADPKSIEVFERLLAGQPSAQIAQDLSMQEPAVRKVKQRIRDRLRDLVAEQLREEDHLGEH